MEACLTVRIWGIWGRGAKQGAGGDDRGKGRGGSRVWGLALENRVARGAHFINLVQHVLYMRTRTDEKCVRE